jgi:hypothetical protein
MKQCKKCLETKELDKFATYKNSTNQKTYIHSYCKVCNNKTKEVKRRNNPTKESIRERSKRLKYKYGITIQDYNNMYSNQQGLCKICGDHYVKLFVDHCHDSQAVRGLLCHHCNTLLGMSKDRVDILNRAILYLKATNTDKSL